MTTRPEFPPPIRRPGEPPVPPEPAPLHHLAGVPDVVDAATDLYGAEETAARVAERLARLDSHVARVADDGEVLLTPPLGPGRDRIAGPATGPVTLLVFGAHATPWSRSLGAVLEAVRRRHIATVAVAWRHYPDPVAHPRAVVFALAVEAAAQAGRFWTLTRELLRLRHDDPDDLRAAIVRSSLDPDRRSTRCAAEPERTGSPATSRARSQAAWPSAPTLFIAGERYRGELRPASVLAAIERVPRGG